MFSIYTHRQAFSLVELSIVLVILGLLVGGILAGQSLIKASELRKVGADFAKYEAAVNAFRDKYFFYPGDLPNATQLWGRAAGTAGNDVSCYDGLAAGAAPGTCDGDGNGYISQRVLPSQSMKVSSESIAAWQHLSLAGMVEGQYTGIITLTTTEPYGFVAGVNIPAAPIIRGAVYGLGMASGGTSGVGNYMLRLAQPNGAWIPAQNVITLGKPTARSTNFSAYGGLLDNETAWSFDAKHDDGIANTGKVRAAMAGINSTQAYWEDGGSWSQTSGCQAYLNGNNRLCTLAWIFGPL